ncbi:MAG: type II secretion system protein GspF, partial [Aquabacterium sp.]|nr:type II secretion system protein GspF [Aquabacterium sp.]
MSAFRFEALDAAGKTVTGLVEADNPKAARAQLRTQHLVPLKVDVVVAEAEGQSRVLFASRVFNASALSIWTRQLSGLVV